MRTIALLPSSVIEKIAAGEVVERPAAVIKELVENCLDAGATAVDIHVEDAGFSLIRVSDNGGGMSKEDLGMCMLRHATSKIMREDDLFAIGTFGFRGEALGSIAAVSRMSVATSTESDGSGLVLSCEGGALSKEPVPHAHLRGTTIAVRDLFFNVPARKKFMKTRRGEQLAIVRMLEQLVIPFPGVHFTLTIDGNSVFDLPAVESPLQRIAGIAGQDFATSLIECRGEREKMDVTVYISHPDRSLERPRFQCLYVNLRRINSEAVFHSIREAYSRFIVQSRRPAFFCFLTIDPASIDVNVHPTKQQIKFENEREIFGFIYAAIHRWVGPGIASRSDCGVPESRAEGESGRSTSSWNIPAGPETGSVKAQDSFSSVRETPFAPGNEAGSGTKHQKRSDGGDQGGQTILTFPDGRRVEKEIDRLKENTIQLGGDEHERIWDLIPCYQIHAMFILAPIKNGILLIDQHAAHERILFEQAMERSEQLRTASQQLLFPIVMELSPAEKQIVESGREYFLRFGFEIGDFGGRAISVSAIPAFVHDGAVEATIREMVRYLLEGRDPALFNEPDKRFAAAFACGAAIKAGQRLSQEEMNALLNNLFSSENPYTCPHGRPTLIRMSIEELSRRFLR